MSLSAALWLAAALLQQQLYAAADGDKGLEDMLGLGTGLTYVRCVTSSHMCLILSAQ